ncbi:MAG TPA: DUF4388 domain-containing protein [Planctomycetota bacterium]
MNSLIEGYCDDFVSFASMLAQTLEQVSMRGLGFDESRESLERIERGMRDLAGAIHELLERGTTQFEHLLRKEGDQQPPALGGKSPLRMTTNGQGKQKTRPAPLGPRPTTPVEPATTSTMASVGARPVAPRRTTTPAPNPATPAANANQREPLRGTSQSMPVLSVFQFLGRTRKTGVMRVAMGSETLTFELVNGCIQLAISDNSPSTEQLGELLIERRVCTRERIGPLLTSANSSNERLGSLLLQQKLVTNGQILEALEVQVQRRFTRACKHTNTSYQFDEGAPRPTDGRIRITPLELTFEHRRGRRN